VKRHSLEWWARKLYQKSYIDLTDKEAEDLYDEREKADGEKRESKPEPSNSSAPSESLA
jgi:hypothetical protein